MNRKQRLQSAKSTSWLEKFSGKNPIAGYRRWFGVDLLCALAEIKMLGFKVPSNLEAQIRESVAQEALRRQSQKAKKDVENECLLSDWESEFAYIAGYTSGGAPYGLLKSEVEDGTCYF